MFCCKNIKQFPFSCAIHFWPDFHLPTSPGDISLISIDVSVELLAFTHTLLTIIICCNELLSDTADCISFIDINTKTSLCYGKIEVHSTIAPDYIYMTDTTIWGCVRHKFDIYICKIVFEVHCRFSRNFSVNFVRTSRLNTWQPMSLGGCTMLRFRSGSSGTRSGPWSPSRIVSSDWHWWWPYGSHFTSAGTGVSGWATALGVIARG